MSECRWAIEGVKLAECHCPTRFNQCRLWVRWYESQGDYSRGHGGWLWLDPEAAKAWKAAQPKTDPNACVGGVCRNINELCSRHSTEYQDRHGRASNE